jgi:hypothetical protein
MRPLARLEQAGHQLPNLGRRVELAPALAGRRGELRDQPLVGLTEHVGGHAIRVEWAELVEVLDYARKVITWKGHLVVEVRSLEDPGQLFGVRSADRGERVVQGLPLQCLVGVPDVVPRVSRRNLENVECRIASQLFGVRDVTDFLEGGLELLRVKVRGSLEEEQSKDVVLLIRDLVPEEISGLPKVIFQTAQRERDGARGCHAFIVRG